MLRSRFRRNRVRKQQALLGRGLHKLQARPESLAAGDNGAQAQHIAVTGSRRQSTTSVPLGSSLVSVTPAPLHDKSRVRP